MTTDQQAQFTTAEIAHDAHMDRHYIPLPGGWEMQTKGKGSTFRLCDTKADTERWPVLDSHLHEPLERMARDIHAAWGMAVAAIASGAPPAAGTLPQLPKPGYTVGYGDDNGMFSADQMRAFARAAIAAGPAQSAASAPYASALADVTAAWVPFSRRLEIAEKAGTVVDAQFNQIVRDVVEYMVREKDAPPPVPAALQRTAFSSALRGLVESLSREPIPEELRFAAHELTVMADRISAKARRGEDDDA